MYSLRNLDVWVCNLNNEPIHLLYSSSMMFENSIHNIVKTESRNGGKELSFTLNNRDTNIQWDEILAANYLIPEYRIRTEDDNGEDYYLITSDSIQHNNASKNINIKVKHISCLLKFQALDLVFSDEYANTVGTAEQLCVTILAETDWSYDSEGSAKFYEKDGVTEKYRTLTASAKTGAFALLTKAADLFDAKVLFDGATKTVRLLPMNPFSIDKSTGLPDMRYASNVIEINYGVNAKSISRTRDSENIATCLYAYGAYGDNVSKFCGLQDIKYRKYSYTYIGTESQYCKFVIDSYITGTTHNVFFDTTGCEAGDVLEYYALDAASDLYVWNATKELALLTVDECTAQTISPTYEELTRDFSFLMDFSYYKENGMLTETQIQTIAEYQVNSFAVLEEIRELSTEYSEDYSELSKVININDYCKLAATPVNQNQLLYLQLDTSTYQDGIIYHTQADTTIRKKWFTWRVATAIDDNGNAVNTDASVIYMVSTDATYVKTYIKEIIEVDGQKTGLLLWLPFVDRIPVANAGYYLFSANTVSGYLGNCECNIETIKQTLKEQTTYKGIEHPVYFRTTSDTAPAVPTDLDWAWLVFATKGTYATWVMYFYGGVFGDTGWIKCMANTRMPTSSDTGYGYWYHISSGGHYRRIEEGGVSKWILIYDTRDIHETKIRNKEIAGEFTSVWQAVAQLAKIYRGYSSEYKISITADKPAGRYFIKPSVANLTTDDNIMFSTDYPLVAGDVLVYDTIKGLIYKQDYFDDTSVSVRILSNAVVQWYPSNELDTTDFLQGSINDNGGIETSTTHVRTGTFTLRPNTPYQYTTTKPLTVYYYDGSNIFISKLDISATGTRTTPAGTRHAKICMEGTVEDLSSVTVKRASNTYASYLVYNDEEYNRISTNTSATGYTISLAEGLKNFRTYSDKIYLEDKPAIAAKQAEELAIKRIMMESLGSIYRESYKQDSAYVEGDEQKLFDDSLEDLETLSKPTTTYNLEYVDRFLTDENDLCKWEDVDINTAVYLIDDELNIEQWAFVDSIKTCYDEHAKSSITINTSLTKLSQQSFTDVLSNIAKVSEETKSSADIYKRAEALSSTGNLTAEKLEGELYATTVNISGGSSSWTTDEKGNMIFTSADNASAMMLAGSGLLISNKKDEFGRFVWRTAIDGKGINADVVNTGELNAELITAGTITADKLSSVAGEGLDISSNKEVLLFATVSGSRPSGKLEVLRDGGSLVSINSTDGITIASGANVDIAAGNTVDIAGSDVNISGTNVSMTAASTLAMTSSTMNVDSGSINVLSDSTISVKSGGNISVESGGAVSVAGGQSGSGVLINNDGVTVTGEDINLLTNSGTTGKIYLGSNTNYISSAGVLSLHNGDLVLDGADGSLTTKAAMNIAAGGNINLTTDTSAINMEAGNINIAGGTLTANGGAVDIKATSTLDIDSPNFKIVSSTGSAEIAGKVIASSGLIGATKSGSTWSGGWNIGPNKIYSGSNTSYVELNSDTSTNFAIKIGGENDPTQENAANFAVRRDGTTIINQLQRYTDDTHTALETIDLRKSLWQLNYGILNYEKKEEDDGSITLTIKRTGMPELSVNFISAGGAEIRFKNSLTENVTVENYKGTKTFKSATGYLKSILYVQDNKLYDEVTLYGRDSGQPASLISAGVLKTEIPLTGSFKENTSTGSIDYSVEYNTSEVLTGHAQLSIVVPSYDLTSRKITTKARAMSTGKTVGYDSSQYSLDSNISTQGTSSSLYASASSILTLNGSTYTTDTVNYYPAVSHSISGRTLTITSLIKQGSSSGTTRAKTSETIDVTDLLTPVSPTATTTIDVLGTERKFKTKTVYEKLTSTYYRIGTAHVPSNVTPIGSSYTSSSGYLCNSYLTIPTTTYNLISTPHTSTTITPISMSSYTSSEGYYSSSVIKVPVATHNLVVTPYTSTTITPISMASYTSTVGCLCDGTITAEPDVHYVTDEAKTSEAIRVINTEYTTVNKDIIGSEGTKVSVEEINKSYDIDYDYLAAAEGEKYPQAKRTKVRYELHWGDIIGTEHEPVKKIIQPNTGYSIELKTVQGTEGDKVTITPIGNSYTTVSGYLRGDEGDKVTVPNIVMAHVVESCDYIGTEHTPVSKKIQGNTGYEVVMRNLLGTEGTTKQVTKVGTSHTTTAGQLIGNTVSKTVSVTPISGSGYTSTGGYFSVATTTAGTATNIIGTPHSSSSVTPIGTSHTYSTRKLLRSDGAMSLHTTLYEKDGEEYHSVGYGYWHMWHSDVSPYIENSSSTYAVPYLYESSSGSTTLYEAGTEINSIEYDGTLYEASAATYATVEPQYAGQSLGVSPSGGQYAKVGAAGTSSKTVYEAGAEYTHHPTDKTLYESGSVVTVVNGVSPSKIVFEEGDKEDVYSATTPLYKNGGTSYTVSGLPVGTSTLYTEGTATDVIVTDSSLYERGGSKFTIDGVHIGETVYSKWGDTEYYKTDVTLYKDNGACRYVDAEDVPTTLYAPGTDETLYDSSSKLYRTGGSRMCVVDPIPVGTSTLYGKGTEENVIESDTSLYERDGSVRYVNNAAAVSYLDETEDIDVYKADTKLYQRGTYVGYVGDTPFSSVPGTLYDKKASSDYYDASSKLYTNGGQVKAILSADVPLKVYSAKAAEQYIKHDGTLYTATSEPYALVDRLMVGKTLGTNPSAVSNFADVGATAKTVYEAGTPGQYIKYDGTLYTPSADKKAVLDDSYAGQYIGLNPTHGNYADVGATPKTVYEAGTTDEYIKYDGTLYEASADKKAVLSNTYAGQRVGLNPSAGNYIDVGGSTKTLYDAGTQAKYIKTDSTLYEKGLEENNIQETTVFVEDSTGTTVFYDKGETKNVIEITSGNNGFVSTEDTLYKPNN